MDCIFKATSSQIMSYCRKQSAGESNLQEHVITRTCLLSDSLHRLSLDRQSTIQTGNSGCSCALQSNWQWWSDESILVRKQSTPGSEEKTQTLLTWMSSLNMQWWFRYLFSRGCACAILKSSNCSTALGHLAITAATNSSRNYRHTAVHIW